MSQRSAPPVVLLLVAASLLLTPRALFAWGDNGHRVSGRVAQDALSDEARQAVQRLAGERTLAMLATWPDFARSDPSWDFVSTWHYVNVADDQSLDEVMAAAERSLEPDNVVEAIGYFQAILAGDAERRANFEALMEATGATPREGSLELTALCFLAHFLTDLHQPLHVGRAGDRGGNSVAVNFFGEIKKLHSVWDSALLESQRLSFTELTEFLHAEYRGQLEAGDGGPRQWAQESRDYRLRLYEIWGRTSRENFLPELGYRYVYDHIGTVKQRLYLGGLRLAALLNEIYDR
jgi:hypothetical protein